MALFQPMTSYFDNQILSVPIARENIKVQEKHSEEKKVYLDKMGECLKDQIWSI